MKNSNKSFFSVIFACICFVILAIGLILNTPFDYIKYKCSPYYKKYRKKYRLTAGIGYNFKLCNEIIKNDLPIDYIENPMNDSVGCGYFVFGRTLIIINAFDFRFNKKTNTWQYYDEDDSDDVVFTLDDYIELEIDGINQALNKTVCDDAIVLIKAKCVDDLDKAKGEKRFLLYDKDRAEVLKNYCGTK